MKTPTTGQRLGGVVLKIRFAGGAEILTGMQGRVNRGALILCRELWCFDSILTDLQACAAEMASSVICLFGFPCLPFGTLNPVSVP